MPHLTFTGIYGDMRRRGKEQIESFPNLVYSGSLLVGETTHLITDPTALPTLLSSTAPSEKLRLAIDACIPVISHKWLEDSATLGRLLPTTPYEITNFDPAVQIKTGASWTSGNEVSPIEKLREAPAMSPQDKIFDFINGAFSPGQQPSNPIDNPPQQAAPSFQAPPQPSFDPEDLSLDALSSPDSHMHSYGSLMGFSDFVGASPTGARSPGLPPIPEEIEFNPLFEMEERDPASKSESPGGAAPIQTLTMSRNTTGMRAQRSSLLRFAPMGAAHLPHSLVTPGPPIAKKPSPLTLAGIRKHHNTTRAPFFFETASVLIGRHRRQEVLFTAGDIAHGAKIIYDVVPETGQQIFAHVIIKSIYTLAGKVDDIWMEHHYLFNVDDVEERPAWRAALQGQPMEDDELLLSANAYHSPCNLIVGDFGVVLEEASEGGKRQRRKKVGHGVRLTNPNQYFPILGLGRAFNAAEVREVPLYNALLDFS